MAESKKGIMGNIFNKVLPYLDPQNVTEKIGDKIAGTTEAERNESRTRKTVTGEGRPTSHKVVEGGALVAPVLAEAALATLKGMKAYKGIQNAAENPRAFDMLNDGVKSVDDYRVINEMSKAGNAITEAGVDAAKSAKKGKIIKNKPKAAFSKNKKAAQTVLDNAKDAVRLNETIERAEPERIKRLGKLIDYVDEMEDKLPYEEVQKLNESMMNTSNEILKTTFDDAAKSIATEKGLKSAGTMAAIDKALKIGSRLGYDAPKENKSTYTKPPIVKEGGFFNRDVKNAMNWAMNTYFNLGTDPKKYNMDEINYLIKKMNEDDYFDQEEIDSLSDAEKIWFLKDIRKGKFNSENTDKSFELAKAYYDLTNNSEDKQ